MWCMMHVLIWKRITVSQTWCILTEQIQVLYFKLKYKTDCMNSMNTSQSFALLFYTTSLVNKVVSNIYHKIAVLIINIHWHRTVILREKCIDRAGITFSNYSTEQPVYQKEACPYHILSVTIGSDLIFSVCISALVPCTQIWC